MPNKEFNITLFTEQSKRQKLRFKMNWMPSKNKKFTTFHKSENDVILTKFFHFYIFVYEESKSERFS